MHGKLCPKLVALLRAPIGWPASGNRSKSELKVVLAAPEEVVNWPFVFIGAFNSEPMRANCLGWRTIELGLESVSRLDCAIYRSSSEAPRQRPIEATQRDGIDKRQERRLSEDKTDAAGG